jgi:hypothetical protein
MRVRFQAGMRQGWVRGGVSKPLVAPEGYTRHTAITEWLTLNCRGAWAGQTRNGWFEVQFELADDAERAKTHYAPLGLWR